MSEQERSDLTRLEERVSVLEKKVQEAQATGSGALGMAGVAFAFWVYWVLAG